MRHVGAPVLFLKGLHTSNVINLIYAIHLEIFKRLFAFAESQYFDPLPRCNATKWDLIMSQLRELPSFYASFHKSWLICEFHLDYRAHLRWKPFLTWSTKNIFFSRQTKCDSMPMNGDLLCDWLHSLKLKYLIYVSDIHFSLQYYPVRLACQNL